VSWELTIIANLVSKNQIQIKINFQNWNWILVELAQGPDKLAFLLELELKSKPWKTKKNLNTGSSSLG
jgi:hypothetical protein